MPAQLEPRWAWERLAEDQAGPVVESFKCLSVELVGATLLTAWLGRDPFRGPTPYWLAIHAVQPASRDEFRVLWCATHLLLLSCFY